MPGTRRHTATRRHAARRRPAATKVDLYATHKREYVAPRTPTLVRASRARYLAVSGKGKPGSPEFQECIGALYAVAYTIKVARKFAGRDFAVSKLEGQYWWADPFGATAMETCEWQLLIRVPTFISERDVRTARARLTEQGKGRRVDDVQLIHLDEGRCVQMLHVGPYDAEQATIDEMIRFATAAGLHIAGRHHEIYLSDPRRVPPERLKTILRQPVA